jgi:sodium-coupled monocarboxylate transporter 8/12
MEGPNVDDVRVALQKFGWPDYAVFLCMLSVCLLIGVYFGFVEKKSKGARDDEAADYLVGGRKMKTFPVAMSLIARY